MENNIVLDTIFSRRSIRSYMQNKPVETEKIELLLKAGMAAPSTCNLQVWEFVVVTSQPALDRLVALTVFGHYAPPMAMVICANTANFPGNKHWRIECSAAVENMMIAARSMGLGSVWIGSFDMQKLRDLLSIPDNIEVMNIVYFGYPAENKAPDTKYNEQAVYWEKYDPTRKRAMRTLDMQFK